MWLKPKCEVIKERRRQKGLSMRALSMRANLGKSAVMRMECNLHRVHPLRAAALAQALGCSVEDLFESDDMPQVAVK